MSYKFIFGPVSSRRFGSSLGVDLSPAKKCCNFDCLYCELPRAKAVKSIDSPPAVSDIIGELKSALRECKDIDVITITANGEPSLYPFLGELIKEINSLKTTQKTLILSNGSSVLRQEAFSAMLGFDIVKLSLDSAILQTFRRIDRAIEPIEMERLVTKMAEFRAAFSGLLVMEILVVAGYNDSPGEFLALNAAFKKIAPDRVDISTIDRPPAHSVQGVSAEVLHSLASHIDAAPLNIATRTPLKHKFSYTKDELSRLLKLRPQSAYDIEHNFSDSAKEAFSELERLGVVRESLVGGVKFYRI